MILWQEPFSERQFHGFCCISDSPCGPDAGIPAKRKRATELAPQLGNHGLHPPPKLLPKHGDRAHLGLSLFPMCSLKQPLSWSFSPNGQSSELFDGGLGSVALGAHTPGLE